MGGERQIDGLTSRHDFSGRSGRSFILPRYAELTAIAARHGFYPANCLHQSLALCRLLRRLGAPSHLRIGVKKGTGSLQAHAWVEVNDCVLGPTTEEFSRFESLGPMAANRETSS
ncbi:MAG: lasso peptide biosynthesis B2 protein [Comamonadaceae bacterium]|nr:lasso peptide biosynthesis B2 protein [Comamonadaceae bacterium]